VAVSLYVGEKVQVMDCVAVGVAVGVSVRVDVSVNVKDCVGV
jgi:hypothetical protein